MELGDRLKEYEKRFGNIEDYEQEKKGVNHVE